MTFVRCRNNIYFKKGFWGGRGRPLIQDVSEKSNTLFDCIQKKGEELCGPGESVGPGEQGGLDNNNKENMEDDPEHKLDLESRKHILSLICKQTKKHVTQHRTWTEEETLETVIYF